MNCANCGAPIPPKSNICRFCDTVNDTDLRGFTKHMRGGSHDDRPCPRCGVSLGTFDIAAEGGFEIGRCPGCLGIFFDQADLRSLVGSSASQVDRIDKQKIAALIEEEGGVEIGVTYIKCPVCQKLMNRRSYGAKSGVVADVCEPHGIWLDGGELGRIFKWAKAGGLLHDAGPKDGVARSDQPGSLIDELEYEQECRAEKMADYFLQTNSGGILRTLMHFLR